MRWVHSLRMCPLPQTCGPTSSVEHLLAVQGLQALEGQTRLVREGMAVGAAGATPHTPPCSRRLLRLRAMPMAPMEASSPG